MNKGLEALKDLRENVCGYHRGLSTRKLGDMFNVSKTTISNVLKSLTREN